MKPCVTVITSVQTGVNMNCIERQLLPQFDYNIERVLGIILLYQFVLNSSLNQVQQAECSDVYSIDLLAHYLAVTCLEQEHNDSECDSHDEFCIKYEKRSRDNGKNFIADILLFYFYQVGRKQTNRTQMCLTLTQLRRHIFAQRKPLGLFNTSRLPVL